MKKLMLALDPRDPEYPEQDFIKSDLCHECGGVGFIEERHQAPYGSEKFQCETCEEMHQAEIRADRMCDEMKGN